MTSSPTDLHTRLVAAVLARRELAQAATPGPWEHVDFSDPSGQPLTSTGDRSTYMGCGSVITLGEDVAGGDVCAPNGDLYPRSGYSPLGDMAFIAANDPAQIFRDTEAHLKILERHRPGSLLPSGRRLCSCAHPNHTPYVEECDAVLDLAGIYPEATEQTRLDSGAIH